MSAVLTANSTVTCGHLGTVLVQGSTKLSVSSGGVLLENGILQSVSAVPATQCQIPVAQTNTKCTKVLSVLSTSLAQKLTVGGKPVALVPLSGTTNGVVGGLTPQQWLTALANQTKLSAV